MTAKALDWLVLHVNEFDPFKGGRPFEIKHGQRIGELAILLNAYVSITGDRASEQAQTITALLESVQSNRAFADRLLRSPVEFVLFAEVYASLRAVGHDNLCQRELIQRVIDARFLEHTERLPHRMMDIVSCLEWGGFHHSFPSLESLCATSILAPGLCPLLLDDDGIYFLTHVVMFFYGFGIRTHPSLPADQLNALARVLSPLLIIASQERHWDLLAELLLCWECVELQPTFIYQRAWDALIGVQNKDGAIPGPEWALKLQNGIEQHTDAAEDKDFYFAHHYHTTLVSIIAGCLRTKRLRLAARRPFATALPLTGRGVPVNPCLDHSLPGASPLEPDFLNAISNARRWFQALSYPAVTDCGKSPNQLCRLLLGFWICDDLSSAPGETFSSAAHRLGETLVASDLRGDLDWSTAAPALKLVVAGLLASQGVLVPSLHSRAGLLSHSAAVLGGMAGDDAHVDLLLGEKRFLLYVMGLHPRPAGIDYAEILAFARILSLASPLSEVEDLLLRINSWTSFGTSQIKLDQSDTWIAELLAGFAMSCLRKYDLIMGCRILRAMSYLGVRSESIDQGLRFLRLHQRSEGSFGFFGTEVRRLSRMEPDGFSADRDLYLPVTIECLWALREGVDRNWRLYKTIPAVALPLGVVRQ
jgi:hypothetical protein